ncbi:MAG: glucose-6-phosphate isomerase, partial [Brevundimonas sp.]
MTDAAWTAFDAAAEQHGQARILDQFAADPDRLSRMTVEAAGLWLDLSKQSWTREAFEVCLELARASGVEPARARLFGGEAVNDTEGRAVLHPALRAAVGSDFRALGEPVSAEVDQVRRAMAQYATAVREGHETGATGKPFKAIVHVGIGGSDLGPRLIWDALRPLDPAIDIRFVANIDPRDMAEALTGLEPETTLVIVVSKTFTTQETLANAELAMAWLAAALPEDGRDKHFIGVTASPERAQAFGCGRTFAFRDWVGG